MTITHDQESKIIEIMQQDEKDGLYNIPDFQYYRTKVEEWAEDKGILQKATPLTQHSKTDEEVNELFEALIAQNNSLSQFANCKGAMVNTNDEIKDAVGDILVTLIIQCKLQGIDPVECLRGAYNIIKKRTGTMVNGVFVKNK